MALQSALKAPIRPSPLVPLVRPKLLQLSQRLSYVMLDRRCSGTTHEHNDREPTPPSATFFGLGNGLERWLSVQVRDNNEHVSVQHTMPTLLTQRCGDKIEVKANHCRPLNKP